MNEVLSPGAYLGESAASYRDQYVLLNETRYARETTLPAHRHESAFFYLVLEGVCAETFRLPNRFARPAMLVFHPAQEPHANQWPEGGRCFHIEFSSRWLNDLSPGDPLLNRTIEFEGGLPLWIASRMYQEFRQRDPLSPLAIQGLALELLSETSRERGLPDIRQPPRWIAAACELLHDRFAERFSLEEIATEVGVHPSHLARTFRQHYHCTLGEYARKLRVDHCCRRMVSTDLSLCEIALEAGFTDQSHFCNTFKAQLGLTPSEYLYRVR